jgi:hypothetical protein
VPIAPFSHWWKTDYPRALRQNDLLRKAVLVILLQRTICLIHRKGYMMNKYLSLFTAALVLGTVTVASARTVTRYHAAAASATSTAESFQKNWNISY